MRHFVRQSIEGGRVCTFNQYYKSNICKDILKIVSQKLKVEGNVYDMLDAYMKYKNEHLKVNKQEYKKFFYNYRDIDEGEEEIYVNKKLGKLPIHQLLQQLSLNDFLRDFNDVSLCLGAVSEPESIYPRIETGYVYIQDMNDELVEKFRSGNFTPGGAILKRK